MKTALLVQGMKRYVAVVLILLTLGFAVEPITGCRHIRQQQRRRKHDAESDVIAFWKKHRDKLTVGERRSAAPLSVV